MRLQKWFKWLAPLFALALVASACGSSKGTSAEGTVIDNNAKGAAQSALNNTSTTASAVNTANIKTEADWEALWKTQREAIVAKAKANGWQWDQAGKKVTGPEGFTVDLSKCPSGWDPYEGLSGGNITIGQTIAQSGTLAASRMLDMTNPNLLDGIKYNMTGNTDGYPIEGSEFAIFDAANQTWATQADLGIIELSGKSKPCAWDQSTSSCK